MANGYLEHGVADQITYYDMFFRRIPDGGGFAIMAGLEQVIEYLKNLHFTERDIAYLRGKNCFCEEFLDYLANFKFSCDVWAIPEGMPVFPGEPLLTVRIVRIGSRIIAKSLFLGRKHLHPAVRHSTQSRNMHVPIRDILDQGGQVDSFGVGERLVTAKSDPVFGGVYKLAAVEKDGQLVPKIKISENVEKITNPGFKKSWRLYECGTGKAIADVITLADEVIDDSQPYEIFDPSYTWKRKIIKDFVAKPLQVPVFVKGECVYQSPNLQEIQQFCKEQIATLWDEVLRFEHPHNYNHYRIFRFFLQSLCKILQLLIANTALPVIRSQTNRQLLFACQSFLRWRLISAANHGQRQYQEKQTQN